MLPIPLKNSTGVNLLNPLRVYVSNEYSKVILFVRTMYAYKHAPPSPFLLPSPIPIDPIHPSIHPSFLPSFPHSHRPNPSIHPSIPPPIQEEAAAVEGDLKSLERLRTMALQARAATEASVATLLQYYAQAERIQGVFPIHPDGVRVAFTWHDAFRYYYIDTWWWWGWGGLSWFGIL